MKFKILLLSVFLTLSSCTGLFSSKPSDQPPVTQKNVPCPASQSEWMSTIHTSIQDAGRPTEAALVPTQLLNLMDQCPSSFDTHMAACGKNLKTFKDTVHQATYFDSVEMAKTNGLDPYAIPEMFKNGYPQNWPQLYERCQTNPSSDPLCEEMKTWGIVAFDSRHDGFQGVYSRLYVRIPHENYEQFLLMFPNGTPDQQTNTPMIILQKKDMRTGQPLAQPIPYFFQQTKGSGFVAAWDCYRCHTNGARQLVPEVGSFASPWQRTILESENKIIQNLGSADYEKYFSLSGLGPELSVGETCTHCHTTFGGERLPLTAMADLSMIRGKMTNYEFTMPPSLRKNPKYQTYFEALKLVGDLPADEQLAIKNNFSCLPPDKEAFDQPYHDPQMVTDNYHAVLQLLKDKNKISAEQLTQSTAILDRLQISTSQNYQKYITESKQALEEWLTKCR